MSRNVIIFIIITLILLTVIFISFSQVNFLNGKTATVNGKTIKLEIADTPEAMQKGLSKYDSFPEDKGMLFVFKTPGKYQFWMKDMKFPIDIIYLQNEKIVTIYKNIPHEIDNVPNLNIYEPKKPADKVLELNAGQTDVLKIKEGDIITLQL